MVVPPERASSEGLFPAGMVLRLGKGPGGGEGWWGLFGEKGHVSSS
jgi:hypothetical protein